MFYNKFVIFRIFIFVALFVERVLIHRQKMLNSGMTIAIWRFIIKIKIILFIKIA